MLFRSLPLSLLLFAAPFLSAQPAPAPVAHWTLDQIADRRLADTTGHHPGHLVGAPAATDGIVGRALLFNAGATADLVRIDPAPALDFSAHATFTVSAWVRPDTVGAGQMLVVGKNNYALGQREWSLLIDNDSRPRFYLRDDSRWRTLGGDTPLPAGQWTHLALTLHSGDARLYVGGQLARRVALPASFTATPASLSIGGSPEGAHAESVAQPFLGVIDDVKVFSAALDPAAVAELANETVPDLELAERPAPDSATAATATDRFPLWQGPALPTTADMPVLRDVVFSVVKAHEPENDGGYHWLHGVALAWHDGRLHATFGHNRGKENTASEEARGNVSLDGGLTWGPVHTLQAGDMTLGVSHGVFLSHGPDLWSFHGAFYDDFARTHTRAYKRGATDADWLPVQIEIGAGFWPLQEPVRMTDGNWIMSGIHVGRRLHGDRPARNLPAVAISRGDDLTRWDLVVIPATDEAAKFPVWGESTVIMQGARVLNISRWNRDSPFALVAESLDHGRTWSPLRASNLPMAATKPYAGTLSCGRRYLVSSSTADNGNRRAPLTLLLTEPGSLAFTRAYVIRHSEQPGAPDSTPRSMLSYPYAIEHEGKLYVGYSNSGGRRGNNNSGELAIIPLDQLRADP